MPAVVARAAHEQREALFSPPSPPPLHPPPSATFPLPSRIQHTMNACRIDFSFWAADFPVGMTLRRRGARIERGNQLHVQVERVTGRRNYPRRHYDVALTSLLQGSSAPAWLSTRVGAAFVLVFTCYFFSRFPNYARSDQQSLSGPFDGGSSTLVLFRFGVLIERGADE